MDVTSWAERGVLVTGATGMVGSWLCRRLVDSQARVVALVRDADPQSELIRSGTVASMTVANGDLADYATVLRAVNDHDVQVIVHLGAQTIVGAAHRSPLETFSSNVMGTAHVLEAARVCGSQVEAIVVASSDKAYGTQPQLPYTEAMPLQGRNPYDVSKSCTDLVAQTYASTYGLPVAIARAGNIYGGGDLNWSRIVPGTVRALLRHQQPVLRSDGTFLRDYVFVDDAVDAYLLLAERLAAQQDHGVAYNFGPSRPMTVLEMYSAVCDAVGRRVEPKVLGGAASEIHDQYLDSTEATTQLGWTPKYDVAAGLERTVAWYRQFLEHGA